jgi:hypothetical protein
MKKITSVRAVYFLMSLVLLTGLLLQNWFVILFVAVMLQIGVWSNFCPSIWVFEKLGFKKSKL